MRYWGGHAGTSTRISMREGGESPLEGAERAALRIHPASMLQVGARGLRRKQFFLFQLQGL